MSVVDVVRRVVERELALVKDFLTTPKGIFETVDDAIKIVRQEAQMLKKRIVR